MESMVIHFHHRGTMTTTVHNVVLILNSELSCDEVLRDKLLNWLGKYTGKSFGKGTESWLKWFNDNENYLYWKDDEKLIVIDEEAKVAGILTEEYRKTHPWPKEDHIDVPK